MYDMYVIHFFVETVSNDGHLAFEMVTQTERKKYISFHLSLSPLSLPLPHTTIKDVARACRWSHQSCHLYITEFAAQIFVTMDTLTCTIESVAEVTGSEKSPPGGDTAPTTVTDPSRSGEPRH